jgi:hypothetical protein
MSSYRLILYSALIAVSVLAKPTLVQAQPDSAPAVQPMIGKVIDLQGSVSIQHNASVILQANLAASAPPRRGDAIYTGDFVQTGGDGKLSLVFNDGTAFNVNSNARIELNEFIYDPNSKANVGKFSIFSGTLTFVAGQVAKSGSLTVDTPVGTMGIRGTTPRVEVLEDGSVKFSTLVEDDKTAAAARRPAVRPRPQQRQDRTGLPPR